MPHFLGLNNLRQGFGHCIDEMPECGIPLLRLSRLLFVLPCEPIVPFTREGMGLLVVKVDAFATLRFPNGVNAPCYLHLPIAKSSLSLVRPDARRGGELGLEAGTV